jgi:hypothetical protein
MTLNGPFASSTYKLIEPKRIKGRYATLSHWNESIQYLGSRDGSE